LLPDAGQLPQWGVNFSPRHAAQLGLDPPAAFQSLLAAGFRGFRLSCFWDEGAAGRPELEQYLDAAAAAGARVLLTVGMKSMRWPEFYIPIGQEPAAVLEFVSGSVRRHRGHAAVVAWQVENEPRNRSGPENALVELALLEAELALVRELDSRPVVLNCFSHFTLRSELASRPSRWRSAPAELLPLLRPGDVLGLDVYTDLPGSRSRATWPQEAAWLRRRAARAGCGAWVTEAQAEPWGEAGQQPGRLPSLARRLAGLGFATVLLWGAEHWLKQKEQGDLTWWEAALSVVRPAGP